MSNKSTPLPKIGIFGDSVNKLSTNYYTDKLLFDAVGGKYVKPQGVDAPDVKARDILVNCNSGAIYVEVVDFYKGDNCSLFRLLNGKFKCFSHEPVKNGCWRSHNCMLDWRSYPRRRFEWIPTNNLLPLDEEKDEHYCSTVAARQTRSKLIDRDSSLNMAIFKPQSGIENEIKSNLITTNVILLCILFLQFITNFDTMMTCFFESKRHIVLYSRILFYLLDLDFMLSEDDSQIFSDIGAKVVVLGTFLSSIFVLIYDLIDLRFVLPIITICYFYAKGGSLIGTPEVTLFKPQSGMESKCRSYFSTSVLYTLVGSTTLPLIAAASGFISTTIATALSARLSVIPTFYFIHKIFCSMQDGIEEFEVGFIDGFCGTLLDCLEEGYKSSVLTKADVVSILKLKISELRSKMKPKSS